MSLPTFSDTRPALGTPTDELETPAVVADLDAVDRNLRNIADLADGAGVSVRPHTKAHKIPALARRQEDLYGPGVLCQKLSEAEVMVRTGVRDVMLVCPVVGDRKLERLLWVADRADRFATLVDCPGNVRPLADAAARHGTTVGVVVEVDVGVDRMGVVPGESAGELAALIAGESSLELRGVLGHDNHVPAPGKTVAEYERDCAGVADELERAVEAVEAEGVSVDTVVSGASSTARYMARESVVTELDPGRYLFNDAALLAARPEVDRSDCALTVLTTVISRPTRDRAIVDAGGKTLSYVADPTPVPKRRDDVEFYQMSSEHGHVDVGDAPDVSVGDRLEFVVPNAYGPINLHDTLPGVRDGRVEEVWNVSARGKDT
jgi:D-serine deaminase-like pyridoxal phosphate-dependent protein